MTDPNRVRAVAGHGFDTAVVSRMTSLSGPECTRLLESHSLGRVAWQAADGQQILPVTYIFELNLAYVRITPNGILSDLVRPTEVALEVDDLDHTSRNGWSIVVHGLTRAVAAPTELSERWEIDSLLPWTSPNRMIVIQIKPSRIRGRSLHASDPESARQANSPLHRGNVAPLGLA